MCDSLTSVGVQTMYRKKYHDFSLVLSRKRIYWLYTIGIDIQYEVEQSYLVNCAIWNWFRNHHYNILYFIYCLIQYYMIKMMYWLYLVFFIALNTSNFHAIRIKTFELLWTTICTNWACTCRLHKLYFFKPNLKLIDFTATNYSYSSRFWLYEKADVIFLTDNWFF